MIEVGILKNFDSGTYKAGVQLAGSLTTYFDDISVAKNIPSSALVIGNYVIVAIPGGNPRDACVIATWPQGSPGGGAGSFLDLSDTPSSYSGQAGKAPKVNAGEDALEFGLIATKFTLKSTVNSVWANYAANDSSFDALIHAGGVGGLTSTNVPYDNDSKEKSLPQFTIEAQWGKVILHNITRGNSRKITNVDLVNNVITTDASTDDWADNDIITIGSPTCSFLGGDTYSRYFDLDISAEVPATAIAVLLEFFNNEQSGTAAQWQNGFGGHPFEAYATAKVLGHYATAARQSCMTVLTIVPISQKICLQLGAHARTNASDTIATIRIRGYWE